MVCYIRSGESLLFFKLNGALSWKRSLERHWSMQFNAHFLSVVNFFWTKLIFLQIFIFSNFALNKNYKFEFS